MGTTFNNLVCCTDLPECLVVHLPRSLGGWALLHQSVIKTMAHRSIWCRQFFKGWCFLFSDDSSCVQLMLIKHDQKVFFQCVCCNDPCYCFYKFLFAPTSLSSSVNCRACIYSSERPLIIYLNKQLLIICLFRLTAVGKQNRLMVETLQGLFNLHTL